MPFKLNISEKGKTYKLELEDESLVGRKIGEKLKGEEIKQDLAGYELKISGTSDKSGFPGIKSEEGPELKRVLLTEGFGMHKKPKGETKKTRKAAKGLRLRKTVRGNTISLDTIQINLKVIKTGNKKLEEIFPKEQKQGEESKEETAEKKEEQPKEEKEEAKPEENKQQEEKKENGK